MYNKANLEEKKKKQYKNLLEEKQNKKMREINKKIWKLITKKNKKKTPYYSGC